jgi:hypothetical protein
MGKDLSRDYENVTFNVMQSVQKKKSFYTK